ncbi:hypothetical protein B0J18DRAFT_469191 [Chaetomium sp. MPI-SDFR-AT-0129]|nr:hypothetical protein B0J18DRAFT_469191 [Chaetomium sp. MPI-SDFR-AT-0129]
MGSSNYQERRRVKSRLRRKARRQAIAAAAVAAPAAPAVPDLPGDGQNADSEMEPSLSTRVREMEETIRRMEERMATLEDQHKKDVTRVMEFGRILLGEVRDLEKKVETLLRR